MIGRINKYKRMIGDAIARNAQNNELLKQLHNQLEAVRNEAVQNAAQSNEQLQQLRSQLEAVRNESAQTETRLILQHEIAAVNTAAFAEYKNIHAGKDVVILGAGPTLNKYEPLENAIHMGVNRTYKYEKVSLEYYFAQDFPNQNLEWVKDINKLKCKKFLGLLAITPNGQMEASESFCTLADATRYFVDISPSKNIFLDIRYHSLMDFCSVIFPALHFALFTNPRKIYLVGVDTSFGGYFTMENQASTVNSSRHYLNIAFIGYRRLKEFAQRWYPETEIISINPVNLKGLFRDMYTDEHGTLVDGEHRATEERDFSDEAIRELIDRHIEEVILNRLHTESPCKECGLYDYSILSGLSDNNPDRIEVKCNRCGAEFYCS